MQSIKISTIYIYTSTVCIIIEQVLCEIANREFDKPSACGNIDEGHHVSKKDMSKKHEY